MEKEILSAFVSEGKSSHEISKITGKSQTTIRYWLKKYELKTSWYQFQKKTKFGTQAVCNKHGLTEYSDKNRCRKCLVEAVQKRRDVVKVKAVNYKGGKCSICGYNKYLGALEFHHLNPEAKDFSISQKANTRSWEKVKEEINKCILVCSNCHREIHGKLFELP